MTELLPSGVNIAKSIRQRCLALKEKGTKLTVKQAFLEAGLSYRTYKSWRGGQGEPRRTTVQKVEAVLKHYEAMGSERADGQNQNDQA